MKHYFKNLLIAVDQLINAIFGGYCDETISAMAFFGGYCDETISAMAYRNYIHGRWWGVVLKKSIDLIFWPIEKEHCLQSYITEKRRAQLPKEYRCKHD